MKIKILARAATLPQPHSLSNHFNFKTTTYRILVDQAKSLITLINLLSGCAVTMTTPVVDFSDQILGK